MTDMVLKDGERYELLGELASGGMATVYLARMRRQSMGFSRLVAIKCMHPQFAKDPEFVKQAGESSKDALLSCPCGPATGAFADEYTKKFGQEPGTYSTEGYDLGTILLKGIDSGAITRPALLDFVKNYNGQGVARKYQWTDKGELTTTLISMYKVQ